MVAAVHDGGGGDGFPHSTGRYDPGTIVGGGTGDTGGGPHSQSNLEQGGRILANASGAGLIMNLGSSLLGNGARDKVAQALAQSDPATIKDHAQKWSTISTKSSNYATQVYDAMKHLSTWSGDDADKARAVLQGLAATFGSAGRASSSMSSNLTEMASQLQWTKDNYGDAGGVGSDVGNALSGGGGDDEAANAYQNMLKNFETSMGYMPTSVPFEVKDTGPGGVPLSPPTAPPSTGGVGGAPSPSGAGSAPHVGNPSTPNIPKPPEPPEPPEPPRPPNPPENPGIDTPSSNLPGSNGVDYPGSGSSPYAGGGAGISPGLDTSGSLAGYDGAGAGGAGSLGGGAGSGGGLGGVPGGGPGAGGGPGGGPLGAGAGAGAGAGSGGFGGGAGGVVGAGAGGRGGMMPMHGGQNNDDDERERTTWLNEDEDVWGAEENLPGVIH